MQASGFSSPPDKYEIVQACRATFLAHFPEIVKAAGVTEPMSADFMQAAVGDYFDEKITANRRGGFEESDGLTASRISLVGESELELEILLGDMERRLQETMGELLQRSAQRMATLLDRPAISHKDNPVGIGAISHGTWELIARLERGAEESKTLLEHFEEQFEKHLPGAYQALIELLDQYGIKPAHAQIVSNPGRSVPAGGGGSAGGGFAGGSGAAQGGGGFSLGGVGGGIAGNAGDASAPQLSNITMTLLSKLLSRMEAQDARAASAPAADPSGLAHSLAPVGADQSNVFLTGPEAAGIDAIALIFTTIGELPSLPGAIKEIFEELQITYLKLVMRDRSFFADAKHPARLFIDRIADAVVDLPLDAPADHPSCTTVRTACDALRARFHGHPDVFVEAVAALDGLIAARDAALEAAIDKVLPLLEQREKMAQATHAAETAATLLLVPPPPAEIASFIRRDWVRVLSAVALEHGEGSSEWNESLSVIRKLVWSVLPMQNLDDRKQLATMVPGMLRSINLGLDRIALPTTEREAFLDICFSLQTAALRGTRPALAEAPAITTEVDFDPTEVAPEEAGLTRPEVEEVAENDARLSVWHAPLPTNEGLGFNLPGSAKAGDWLEFTAPTGSKRIGRYVRHLPEKDLSLLANAAWESVLCLPASVLQRQVRDRKAKIIGRSSLFDEAVAMALKGAEKA